MGMEGEIYFIFLNCVEEKTVKSSNYDIDIGTVCLCKLLISAEKLLGPVAILTPTIMLVM